MDLGTIAARMTLDISNFTSQLNLAENQAVKLAQETSKAMQFGDLMTDAGKKLTLGLTTPILGIAAAAVKVGNDFEYQMSRVQAISGATSDELAKMSDQAIKLGADTSFSASEAAEGMENLASAGFNASEIMDAMAGVLDLAAVSGGDVALASDAMGTSLRAFGLEASDATHVADVFARAAADTNAEAKDMAEAMKYVAPVAHAMGLSLEESAAAIGIMSDAGIKGSQAGTALRGALSRLARPTAAMSASMEELGISFYDSEGNMVSLRDQMDILKNATAGLTQEERNRHLVTLYGQESLSGMLALMEAGPETIDAMTNSLINADGAAAEMAAVMMDNTKMAIEEMMGAFESAGIIIQQILAPAIQTLAEFIGNLVQKFIDASPVAQRMIVIFGAMLAALGPILVIGGTLITVITKMQIAFKLLGLAALGPSSIFALVVVGIYALVAAFMVAYTKSDKFRYFIDNFGQIMRDVFARAVEFATETLQKLGEVLQQVGRWLSENFGSAFTATMTFLSEQLTRASEALSRLGSSIRDLASSGLEKLSATFQSIKEAVGPALQTALKFISDTLDAMGGSFGKVGAVLGVIASVLVKVGIAAVGLTGPMGAIISVVASFLIMWAKTGELNADGIDQVFEQVNSTISNAADMISKYLPIIIEAIANVLTMIVQTIADYLPVIVEAFVGILETVIQTVVTMLPMLIQVGIDLILALVNGLTKALPQVVSAISTVIQALVDAIGLALPLIVEAAILIITTLLNGIVQALPQLIGAAVFILMSLVTAITQLLPVIIEAGISILLALITGIIQVLPQLLSAVLEVMMAFTGALIELLPVIIEAGIQILMALIQGIISILPTLIEAVLQIIIAIVTALIEALPQIIDAGIQLLLALIQGIISVLPQLLSAMWEIALALLQVLWDNLPAIWDAGVQLLSSLIEGLLSLIGELIAAAVQIGTTILENIANFVKDIFNAGVELIAQLIAGIGQKVTDAANAAKEIGQSVVDSVSGFASDMKSAAWNLVSGFVSGITEKIDDVVSAAASMASSAVDTVKSWLNIASPSKVMSKMGAWTGEGFANGIGGMVGAVKSQAVRIAETASKYMSDVQLDLPEEDMLGKIGQVARSVADGVQAQLNSPEYQLAYSAASSNDSIQPAEVAQPKTPEPVRTDEGEGEGGGVYIDQIIVRDNSDLDTLTRGLYTRNKEVLEGIGNTTTKTK